MSERRTSEVKFRCTPSFKAALQAAADAAGQSLTEYIESAVWAHQNAQIQGAIQGATSALNAIRSTDESSTLAELISTNVGESRPLTREDVDRHIEQAAPKDSAAIVVNDDVPGCKGNCRPWEFCACKAAG